MKKRPRNSSQQPAERGAADATATPSSSRCETRGSSGLSATLDIAGAGTLGDLAVASPDGRYVYATFDASANGQGGVAKVDAFRRTLVDTFLYPDLGRPHGVAYVRGRIRKR